jgi:hypothetical protein
MIGVLSGCFGVPTLGEKHYMREFCGSKGKLPDLTPIKARGIRFTPNQCSNYWGNELCSAATWPTITAPKQLARGFEFVEFDLERPGMPRDMRETFVRFHLENRPHPNCKWVDDSWTGGIEIAIRELEKIGIPPDKCIAAQFSVPAVSEYRFVLERKQDKDKKLLRASLVKTTDSSVIGEVWSSQIGGGDHFAGLGCNNNSEFSKLFNVVVPVKITDRP